MLALPKFNRKLSLLAAAALAAPLFTAAPSASAGEVNWRISIGSHDRGHHHRGDYHGSHGYYKSVWRSPVYRTVYDHCGRARRVCVQRGYFEKVWVSTPRRNYTYGSKHYEPRHQRYDRPYRRGKCDW